MRPGMENLEASGDRGSASRFFFEIREKPLRAVNVAVLTLGG